MRSWKPGRGWRTAIRNTSWWHHNFDGTITARAVVQPKTMPGFDGGEWTQPELWTVRLPLADGEPTRMRLWWKPWRHYWMAPGPVYMLNDKPHRITWWDADHPDRKVLNRQPLPADLVASIEAEEKRFERHMRHVCCYIGPVHVPERIYDAWRLVTVGSVASHVLQGACAFLAGLALTVILFGPHVRFGIVAVLAIPLGVAWQALIGLIAAMLVRFIRKGWNR